MKVAIYIVLLLIAIALNALPVTTVLPFFTLLILLHWSLQKPSAKILWIAFVCGLLLDMITQSVFGAHAFSLVLVVFGWQCAHAFIRRSSMVLQLPLVFAASLLYMLVFNCLLAALHQTTLWGPFAESLWMSVVAWPFVFVLLKSIQRKVAA